MVEKNGGKQMVGNKWWETNGREKWWGKMVGKMVGKTGVKKNGRKKMLGKNVGKKGGEK